MNVQSVVTGTTACDDVLASFDLDHIFRTIRRAEAFRPMCKNCEHLGAKIPANIVDYAQSYSLAINDVQTQFAQHEPVVKVS